MKKHLKKYIKNPMLLVLIIILIFFTPQALFNPGQNRERGVVIALGIDKTQNEFEISFLTFIPTPQQTYKDMTSVITGKGDTIAAALYDAQIIMGRKIGLSHAKTTVVNKELLKEDVADYIDYLSRVTSLSENTVFIGTDSSAKELLEASTTLGTTIGLKLEQIIGYNAENLYVTDTSLEAFYKGYYGREKSSLIGFLSLVNGDEVSTSTEGGSAAQSESGGQASAPSSSSGESKHIKNSGEAILLKNGKMVQLLSVEQLNGINLLNRESKNQIITIDDVEYKGSKHKYSYRLKNKKINIVTDFENGHPIYAAQLILGLELVEIDGPHDNLKINTEFSKMTDDIKKKLDAKLKEQFSSAIAILRENKTDVIGINEAFFKAYRNKYLKFIDTIGGSENFINHVNFKINFILQSD